MQVKCTNVNYFSTGSIVAMPGQPAQAGPESYNATVTFSSTGTDTVGRVDSFSLNYSMLSEPIEFMPGKVYNLNFEPVTSSAAPE